MKIKPTGFEKAMKDIEAKAKSEAEKGFTIMICEKVPDAVSESKNFKYIWSGGRFDLDSKSVSPELYAKIVRAFEQQ